MPTAGSRLLEFAQESGQYLRPTDGSMAAMNFSKSVEQLQKADDAIAEGMAQIA